MKVPSACFGRGQHRAGQTMAEFALAATAFVLLMFGLIDMALLVYNYNTVCSAAREAVRYAIVHSPTGPNPATTAQIQQVAINWAPELNLTASNITVSWPADSNLPSEDDAKVAISYNYKLAIPFLTVRTLTLTSTSQMLVSQ
jgi:Flp pilus assembly protein TadG